MMPIKLNNNNNYKNTPAFKGPGLYDATVILRFFQTNQAVGASCIDVGAMAAPRTIVDMQRNEDAGKETARREFSGVFNHALIGAYGILAGSVMAFLFNKKYGVRADKVFANEETLEMLSKYWQKASESQPGEKVEIFFKDILGDARGFDPHNLSSRKGWNKYSENAINEAVKLLNKEVSQSEDFKLAKDKLQYLKNLLIQDNGAESIIKISSNGNVIETTAENLIDDIYSFAKSITSAKFKDGNEKTFVDALKKVKIRTSILGIAAASAIGFSVQAINNHLTKLKTGKSGFVGVEGEQANKSPGFFTAKVAASGAFGAFVVKLLGAKPANILKNIQFKGIFPTLNQYKAVYGLTIIGRILSARDFNELRETLTRDFLGFVNWIILGGFVQKIVANALDPTLVKHDKSRETNTFLSKLKWLTNSKCATFDEVLFSELKKEGVSVVENTKALNYREIFDKMPPHMSSLRAKMFKMNIAVASGFIYSALVLGIGLPKFNIWLTNKIAENRKKDKMDLAMRKYSQLRHILRLNNRFTDINSPYSKITIAGSNNNFTDKGINKVLLPNSGI